MTKTIFTNKASDSLAASDDSPVSFLLKYLITGPIKKDHDFCDSSVCSTAAEWYPFSAQELNQRLTPQVQHFPE